MTLKLELNDWEALAEAGRYPQIEGCVGMRKFVQLCVSLSERHGIFWLLRMLFRAARPWPGCWPDWKK